MCDTCNTCQETWRNNVYKPNTSCYADIVSRLNSRNRQRSMCQYECFSDKYCDPLKTVNNQVLKQINPKVAIDEDKSFKLWGDGVIEKSPGDASIQTSMDFKSLGKCFPLNRYSTRCADGVINTAPVTNYVLDWIKQNPSFNTPDMDWLPSITTDASGKYTYVAFYSWSSAFPQKANIVVFKINGSDGSVVWRVQVTGGEILNEYGTLPDICVSADGTLVFVAYQSRVDNSVEVTGLSGTDGSFLWTAPKTNLSLSNLSLFQSNVQICTDSTGTNVYVSFITNGVYGQSAPGLSTNSSTNTSKQDVVVAKLNGSTGAVVWIAQNSSFNLNPSVTSITSTTAQGDAGHSARPTICTDATGNNIFVAYQTNVYNGTSVTYPNGSWITNIALFKLGNDGAFKWIKVDNTFNAVVNYASQPSGNWMPSICTDANGKNVYLSYATSGALVGSVPPVYTTPINYAIVVVKFDGSSDTSGTTIWAKQNNTFNVGSVTQNHSSISTDAYGKNVFVTYYTGLPYLNSLHIIVFILNNNGNTIWLKQDSTINTNKYNAYPTITSDQYGSQIYVSYVTSGIVTGGSSNDVDSAIYDIAVLKLDRQCESGSGTIILEQSNPCTYKVMTSVPFVPEVNQVPFTFIINGFVN